MEYLVDCNATQAATRAGYSLKTAYRTGADLLTKTQISERIAAAIEERAERLGYNAEKVLEEAVKAYRSTFLTTPSYSL